MTTADGHPSLVAGRASIGDWAAVDCGDGTIGLMKYVEIEHPQKYENGHYHPLPNTKEWVRVGSIASADTYDVKEGLKNVKQEMPEWQWVALRNWVRRLIAARKEKTWDQVLPAEIVRWAKDLAEKEADDPCIDNYRCALVGNSPQMRRYRKQQENGCCGSLDVIREGPDGRKYMVGCNYGH